MQATSPVDGDVAFATVQTSSTFHTATSTDSTEFKEAVKDWAIITDIVLALLFAVRLHVVGCDFLKELDVLVGVELSHFKAGCRFGALCE
jgi:hypothetical protein